MAERKSPSNREAKARKSTERQSQSPKHRSSPGRRSKSPIKRRRRSRSRDRRDSRSPDRRRSRSRDRRDSRSPDRRRKKDYRRSPARDSRGNYHMSCVRLIVFLKMIPVITVKLWPNYRYMVNCSPGSEGNPFEDGAYYCYCAYVLRISRYSDFLSPMLTNTGIFLRGLKLSGGSRS